MIPYSVKRTETAAFPLRIHRREMIGRGLASVACASSISLSCGAKRDGCPAGWIGQAVKYMDLPTAAALLVDRPDLIAPKWMVSFNVSPVVKNIFAEWFKD
ncbi:MAG: hypothetical protein J7K65_01505 [Planctomycetes bacterium]|nr:hypothetical protein [Planctomycetota bacterium]